MPFTRIQASVIVPAQFAEDAQEELDNAIDHMLLRGIPVFGAEVETESVDPPEDLE